MVQPGDAHCSCCSHTKKEPDRSWKDIRRWAPQIAYLAIRLLVWVREHLDQMPF